VGRVEEQVFVGDGVDGVLAVFPVIALSSEGRGFTVSIILIPKEDVNWRIFDD
jgi:hypothetical protein